MIDVRELRLGNWLKRDVQPDGFQVDSQTFHTAELHPEWYDPVPLTEEWLLRFGFRKFGIMGQFGNDTEFDVSLSNELAQLRHSDSDNYDRVGIKFHQVHQLQNLYFALTGSELEIKENQ